VFGQLCVGCYVPTKRAVRETSARAVVIRSRSEPGASTSRFLGRATEVAAARADVDSDGLDAAFGERPRLLGRKSRRGWLVRRVLLAADVTGLAVAFSVTEVLFRGSGVAGGVSTPVKAVIFALALPVWTVAAKLYGLYDRDEERATHSTADEVMSVFHLTTVGVLLFYATSWLVGLARPDQVKLTTFWLLALLAVISSRLIARPIVRRHPAYVQNTVVVGAGDVGQLIGRKLLQHPEYRINFVGFVDGSPKELRRDVEDVPVLGEPDEIVDIVRRHNVDRVIIAFSQDLHEQMLKLVFALRQCDVQIDVVPRLFEVVSPNAALHGIEGLPLVGLAQTRIPRSSRLLKRGLDVVGASLLLALATPLMLVIAILIRRDSPGPVFFRQVRLGIDMREFTLLKFRTMREGTDEAPHREYLKQIMNSDAQPSSNNLDTLERPEVTRVGGWLRKTSLDELPQLLNVLRGDMSLVGPRPSIPYELELFAPHHFERFLVPAGLTGLWQVEARAHSTFGEALDLDAIYASGWSLGLDFRLLLRTPALMFRKRETG
jgi:exopolysaccharide biosynthesis polyprenyl glycosylphosphotransferase